MEFDGSITPLYNRAVNMKQRFFCAFIFPSVTRKGATKVQKGTDDVCALCTLHLLETAKNLTTRDLAVILVLWVEKKLPPSSRSLPQEELS